MRPCAVRQRTAEGRNGCDRAEALSCRATDGLDKRRGGVFACAPSPDRLFREMDPMKIEALGMEAAGGKPARKYRMTQATGNPPTTSLIWVGMDGYRVKIETAAAGRTRTVTVHYSRCNDPGIKVEPPK